MKMDYSGATFSGVLLWRWSRETDIYSRTFIRNFTFLFFYIWKNNSYTLRNQTRKQFPIHRRRKWPPLILLHGLFRRTQQLERCRREIFEEYTVVIPLMPIYLFPYWTPTWRLLLILSRISFPETIPKIIPILWILWEDMWRSSM